MEFLDIYPAVAARGTVKLPGSKSISNRTLLLAALAEGETHIRDLLASDDTDRMLDALKALGVPVEKTGANDYKVQGVGGAFPVREAHLFLGNAGTAFRPLTAALALSNGHYKLSGVARMHERPIGDLVDALRQLGADIHYLGNEGFPPLEIFPAEIKSGTVKVRGDVSSQFLTGLLMALPLTGEDVVVEVVGELISKPYIEITLALMARFGVNVSRAGWSRFQIHAGMAYRSPGVIHVEGDASSASYFLAAGAIGGGPVRVEGVGKDSIQGDVRFASELARMGVGMEWGDNWIEVRGPESGRLKAVHLDCNHIPDAAMTLAVAALFADGTTRLTNIASWRVKETDRIAAMATELRKVGATVEEGPDYIYITPPAKLIPNAAIDTYDDHRMAMCFSLVALGAAVRINDPKCVAKTFPDYFERFASILKRDGVPVIAIDGPSASGKGTIAQLVAEKLGWHYLDSGAIYRLAAVAALRRGLPLDDEAQLAALAEKLDVRFEGGEIYLDNEIATEAIRTEEAGNAASKIAVFPRLRQALLERQRAFRQAPGLVADGRDMASTVFPDAGTKIFLTASAEARAERRYKQLLAKGNCANLHNILQDINQRDARDAARSAAPLQKCADASFLDTSSLSIDQVVAEVLARYEAFSSH